MEFSYLSDVTGDKDFKDKVQRIRKVLKEAEKQKGLYPNYMNPKTGKWGQRRCTRYLAKDNGDGVIERIFLFRYRSHINGRTGRQFLRIFTQVVDTKRQTRARR